MRSSPSTRPSCLRQRAWLEEKVRVEQRREIVNPTRFEADHSRRTALGLATQALEKAGIAEARGDARFLMLHALGLDATALALDSEAPIGPLGADALDASLRRRLARMPVARILGEWEFWGLPFALSSATLVPRPDTETLVEAALGHLRDRAGPFRIADLGTGSGCILVSLLHTLEGASGLGIDSSLEALETARGNAERNGVADRASFLRGDWCAPLGGPFDLIVANPPYIARGTIADLSEEVRIHDPLSALDGGIDGLDAYRSILGAIAERPDLIAPGGALMLEIGYDQAQAVTEIAEMAGLGPVSVLRDLAGQSRVVTLRPNLPVT